MQRIFAKTSSKRLLTTLAIESSCDDSCIAVLSSIDGHDLDVRSSHMRINKAFGGVLPQYSSSSHESALLSLLRRQSLDLRGVDKICCTIGPGMHTSLSRGLIIAKMLSICLNKPLYGCHHMEGHIYSCHSIPAGQYPFLSLLISGGHTLIVAVTGPRQYTVLSRSLDDNIGEVYDKVAREIPANIVGSNISGSVIEELAIRSPNLDDVGLFNGGIVDGSLDFSFSGLKTEVIKTLRICKSSADEVYKICARLQRTLEFILVTKFKWCIQLLQAIGMRPLFVTVGGGVARNGGIRSALVDLARNSNLPIHLPKPELSCDNAMMIAMAFQNHDCQSKNNVMYPIPEFPLGFLKDDDEALENYR